MIEIIFGTETIHLRSNNAELYILPKYVSALKDLQDPAVFKTYFREQALVNRPARKLFDAWLRKDARFWDRFIPMVKKQFP
jgi:hypothetical protein